MGAGSVCPNCFARIGAPSVISASARQISRKGLLCATAIALWAGSAASGESNDQAMQTVLLRNGELLQGEVSHQDSGIRMRLRDGGEMFIEAWDIACCETSKLAIFTRLQQSVHASALGDQASLVVGISNTESLAEWCLEQHLWEQCEALIADLASNQGDQAVENLQVRLTIARKTATKSAMPQPPTPQRAAKPLRNVDLLPPELLREFCTFVQPLITNSCVRCHSVHHESAFQLRRSANGAKHRNVTQANLLSVLATVENQKLIHACQSVHGKPSESQSTIDFPAAPCASWRHGQLARLETWTERVTGLANATAAQRADGVEASLDPTAAEEDPFDPGEFNQAAVPPPIHQTGPPPQTAPIPDRSD